MARCYALRDDQWDRMKDLLPGKDGDCGVTAGDNRLFVEAVLYRYRAGIFWRDLPERFGDFRVIHTRHMRWCRKGIWKRVFKALAEDADNRPLLKRVKPVQRQEAFGAQSTQVATETDIGEVATKATQEMPGFTSFPRGLLFEITHIQHSIATPTVAINDAIGNDLALNHWNQCLG